MLEIYDEIRKLAMDIQGHPLTLRVNVDVARALAGKEAAVLKQLSDVVGTPITVQGDPCSTRSSSMWSRTDDLIGHGATEARRGSAATKITDDQRMPQRHGERRLPWLPLTPALSPFVWTGDIGDGCSET